jgi:alginate O-acetyltransferase complex protein AlgI
MIFSSIDFFVFLFTALMLLQIFKTQRIKKYILLFSSYFFYAYWDYRFLILIIFSTFVDYIIGKKIFQSNSESNRKKLIILSLVVNLGLLGFFKYFNFFIDSANSAFGGMGLNLSTLNIILPIGISFYTFQTLSYSIDIYRKKIKAEDSFLNFAIFVAFFPQLVAGPIVRAIDFLPQLKNKIQIQNKNFLIGIQIFIFGLIKKVLIADKISPFVDDIFLAPELYNSSTIWLAVILYSIQIYCDFSGYSDMAIGIARMMGFKLPRNFNMPYLSRSLTEFWTRWHISLSSWLKDYLYIPLGGNKKGKTRQYINLIITMLLGGLWHGASWNFIFWGLIHGIGLIIHKFYRGLVTPVNSLFYNIFAWLATYLSICVTWVFFRAQSFSNSWIILKKMFVPTGGVEWLYGPAHFIIPIIIFTHLYAQRKKMNTYLLFDLSTFTGAFVLIFILMTFFYLGSTVVNPFIYFQF